jgi:hypothetical protein
MLIEQIQHWERIARQGFSYVADNARTTDEDKWFSRGDEAVAGKPWTGDCANLASTVLDLCGRAGMPLSVRYFLVVIAQGTQEGHAVGCVSDDTGKLLIVGDTFADAPYPAAEMKHMPVDYHRLSEAEMIDGRPVFKWRAGIPWEVVNG